MESERTAAVDIGSGNGSGGGRQLCLKGHSVLSKLQYAFLVQRRGHIGGSSFIMTQAFVKTESW